MRVAAFLSGPRSDPSVSSAGGSVALLVLSSGLGGQHALLLLQETDDLWTPQQGLQNTDTAIVRRAFTQTGISAIMFAVYCQRYTGTVKPTNSQGFGLLVVKAVIRGHSLDTMILHCSFNRATITGSAVQNALTFC